MQLLAQADAADEEANRLELEKMTVDKEVDRLKSVIERMEDMRYSTRELTNQMHLDTALQMRHLLANGKNIVPRVSWCFSPYLNLRACDGAAAVFTLIPSGVQGAGAATRDAYHRP